MFATFNRPFAFLVGVTLLSLAASCDRGEPTAIPAGDESAGALAPATESSQALMAEPGTDPAAALGPSGEPSEVQPMVPGSGEAVAPPLGGVEGPTFTLSAPPVVLAAQAQGQLELRVVGHSGFHINLEYPWRLILDPPQGVAIDTLEWTSSSATAFSQDEAVFNIPVRAGEPGQHQVLGQLRFSVCSESRCDVPRQAFGWSITVE